MIVAPGWAFLIYPCLGANRESSGLIAHAGSCEGPYINVDP